MFPINRQEKLDPILCELQRIPGIQVEQDDFDSAGINVFLYLDKAMLNSRPRTFLREVKAKAKKIIKGLGEWQDQPSIEYTTYYDPMSRRTEKHYGDYDSVLCKLEIFV